MNKIYADILSLTNKFYSEETKYVQVNYILWNKKKKYIIDLGCSQPTGFNNYYKSIHAEIAAMKKLKNYNFKHIIIIIFKLKKYKEEFTIHPCYCCLTCTKTLCKYNVDHIIYTLFNKSMISAIIDHPQLSIGLKRKLTK